MQSLASYSSVVCMVYAEFIFGYMVYGMRRVIVELPNILNHLLPFIFCNARISMTVSSLSSSAQFVDRRYT